MRQLEMEGATVEAAVEQALRSLDVSLSDVDVEVLDQGSRGILGILGGRSARVRVTVHADWIGDAGATARQAGGDVEADAGAGKTGESGDGEQRVEGAKEHERVIGSTDLSGHERRVRTFLEDVLRLMRVDADVARVDSDNERNAVEVEFAGREVGILIGRRGQTLEALQYLANIAGNRGEAERARVSLDAEGFRARREESLQRLAARTAGRVKATGNPAVLDSMSAMDRRIVHMALSGDPAVTTYSEGEEPHRKVVVAKATGSRRQPDDVQRP